MIEIHVEKNQIGTTLHLSGRLGARSAPILEEELNPLIKPGENFIIDLEKIDFISSRGLWTLIETRKAVLENEGELIIVGLSEDLNGLLEMTGILHLFHIRSNVEEGLVALQGLAPTGDPNLRPDRESLQ